MKIIKQPYPDAIDWSHTWTCLHCNAELEADGKDVYSCEERDWRGDTYKTCYRVNCPLCHTRVDLEEAKLPWSVKNAANQRASRARSFPER